MQAIVGERRGVTRVASMMLAALLFTFGLVAATTTAAKAATINLSSGSLSWGVKESFRNYVSGPIAHGSWTTSDGASDTPEPFVFSGGTGTYDTDTHQTVVAFNGTVAFSGHDGQLSTSFANPRVAINADGSGTLIVDAVSAPMNGAPVQYDDVTLATISGATPTITGESLSVSAPTVTLSEEGAPAFAGFYAAGTALDALTFTATIEAPPVEEPPVEEPPVEEPPVEEPPVEEPPVEEPPVEEPPVEEPPVEEPPVEEPPVEEPPVDNPSDTPPSADDDPAPSPVSPTPSGTAEPTGNPQADQCVANEVTSGSISWGLKSSFRNYISSAIAHGGWTLAGLTYADGAFVWSASSGSFNTESNSGTIGASGTITFTGHDGLLNLTIANPQLSISGATATLYVDVTSTDMEGNPAVNAQHVAFASVNAGSLSVNGTTVSLTGASATLTAAGAEAFASFYQAGTELDPINITAQLGGEVECSSAAGTATVGAGGSGSGGAAGGNGALADTGVSIAVPAGLAGLALLAGGALIWRGRRTA